VPASGTLYGTRHGARERILNGSTSHVAQDKPARPSSRCKVMDARAVGDAAGATLVAVLGEVGDAVAMAAVDAALASGLAPLRSKSLRRGLLFLSTPAP
jgi:hypothetical protein